VLFPPFLDLRPLGIEQIEIVAGMVVSKVRVNVHLNVKNRLQHLENACQRKRRMHFVQFEYLVKELEQQLLLMAQNFKLHDTDSPALGERCLHLVDIILRQCHAQVEKYQTDANDLADHCKFRSMVMESLGVLDMGREKMSLWLHWQSSQSQANAIADIGLLQASRQWNLLQKKELACVRGQELEEVALNRCKLRGLVKYDIEERNEIGETPFLFAAASGHRQVLLVHIS
jgi:hypothetical protein